MQYMVEYQECHPDGMGTNYYVRPHPLWMFEPAENQLVHLGKSSAGWCFLLRVYPERGINDLSDWIPILRGSEYKSAAEILDEYGDGVKYDRMMEIITKRSAHQTRDTREISPHVRPGPNGLLRYAECSGSAWSVRHGAGTWDCVYEDFL